MSSGVSKELIEKASYKLKLTNNKTTYLKIGDDVNSKLYDGSLVILKKNGNNLNEDITKYLTIEIKNSSSDIVNSISTETVETYTITYTIDYNGFVASVSNKVVVREN